ncbi:hypothetical protein FC83_GL000900 [Agrilactobacillus composti DSM 18527 = JCM 14202]|uniref:Uncharacterized protein n=1 Tax=Agrilactobacillus composti DSM 18527 = JCM 14202 TaxID=1423734 RepID=X0PGR3_9LACO|nr:hypothetical protein [Agrilactobacillus composti]KRM35597.1 hypothetical protein FC83_GL000900 [Agrilactobacillus composti DSM 18527 = JCM 14202]GAF41113.1 hypothetical protein JCM14202_3037 [Agrilactobacillus composti DSM 18527 = JCM 14202]
MVETKTTYQVKYVNQVGITTLLEKGTGTIGEKVTITPVIKWGFELLDTTPQGLTLDQDATKNVVTFRQNQVANQFSIALHNLNAQHLGYFDTDGGDGDEESATYPMLDKGTVLWQGKTRGGNIRLPSLIRPDFSNLPNGIMIEGIPISTSTDISPLNFDEYPFRFPKNDIVLNKEYTFNTHVAGQQINFEPGVFTNMKVDGYIKATIVDSKNINIGILAPTYDAGNAVSSFLIAVSKVSVF